jgi:hypothetical protein
MPTIINKKDAEPEDTFNRKPFCRSPNRDNGQKHSVMTIIDYDEHDDAVFKPTVQAAPPP